MLHPILAQLRPSPEQIPPIVERGSDIVVTAGAGTGKTRTLVARYLGLLADGLPLAGVVAITYTRKAAREMRNRIRQEMRRYLERPDLPPAEQARWQQLYTELDAARIGTIHSLCGEILRHHPAEAGVDPRFEVLEEGQAALLQAAAVDGTLSWAADDEQAVALFALLGEQGLRNLVQTLLKQRLDAAAALEALPPEPEALRAYWENALATRRRAAAEALRAGPAFRQAAAVLRETEPSDDGDPIARQRALALEALEADGDLSALGRISLEKRGRPAAWGGEADRLAAVREALKTLRGLYKESADWLALELDELDVALLAHYPALRAVLAQATRRYDEQKAARQALDFDDLEDGALRLLREHAAVRAYWQGQVRALLVDEFQDTNARQRDLIDLLSGAGGKLFIVGDGKQSIYRFRGADVTVFRQKREEIARTGRAYALDTSYRAHRALITALNALLEPVLGPEDPARPYVEPFARIVHRRQQPAEGLAPPYIQVQVALGRKDDALPRAARALAAWLVELVEGDPVFLEALDPETGRQERRRVDYGDVAILCRATASFAPYEDALEAAGVPFLTVAGRGFYNRPEVRDVLNALRALADPTDDLALAGLLRSPAGGLTDIALQRLAQACRQRACPSLWALLEGSDLSFLEEEAPRAAAAREQVRALHAQAGRAPVADVLKAFLDASDYRAALLRAGQPRGARNLAKLLADAHTSEIVGVGAFLEYVEQLRGAGAREGEAHTVASGAVQLMTVHAAKGLEFPIVVLGDAARRSPGPRGTLVDPTLGVLPPLAREGEEGAPKVRSAIYRLALERAQDQEEAEEDRLLYVAATRAQEMLVVSGTSRGSLAGWLQRLGQALPIQAGLDSLKAQEVPAACLLAGDLGGEALCCSFYPEEAELVEAYATAAAGPAAALPAEPALLGDLPAPRGHADEAAHQALQDLPQRVWRVVPARPRPAAPSWVVGQIVHRALAGWRFPAAGEERFALWAEAEARSCGLTDAAEVHNAVLRAARMLRRFQATPLYAEMSAAAHRYHELPYSRLTPEGALESGALDVLYQGPAGWTVVEFKTDDVRDDAHLQLLLRETDYVSQMNRYLEAVTELLGVRPQGVLCFLNYRGEVKLLRGEGIEVRIRRMA